MVFSPADILEIGNDIKILKINRNSKKNVMKKRMGEKTVSDSYIKNKRLIKKIFIMCGEQIYIKKLTVPNLNGNVLEKVIKDELKFYYRANGEIVFSYNILNKNKNNLDLLVFYINSERLEKLNIKTLYNIKAIYMVQFIYIEYVNKILHYKNYLLAFLHDKYFYLIYCENRVLRVNDVQKYFKIDEIEFEKYIINFCRLNNISNNSVERLIISGLNVDLINRLDIACGTKNLGFVKKTQIYEALK